MLGRIFTTPSRLGSKRIGLRLCSQSMTELSAGGRPMTLEFQENVNLTGVSAGHLESKVGHPILSYDVFHPHTKRVHPVDKNRWNKVESLLFYRKIPVEDMHLTIRTVTNWLYAVIPVKNRINASKIYSRKLKKILLTFDPKTTEIPSKLIQKLGFAFSRVGLDALEPMIPHTKMRAFYKTDKEDDIDTVIQKLTDLGFQQDDHFNRNKQVWFHTDELSREIPKEQTAELKSLGVKLKENVKEYEPVTGVLDWYKAILDANWDSLRAGAVAEAAICLSANEIKDPELLSRLSEKVKEKITYFSADHLVKVGNAYARLGDQGYAEYQEIIDVIIEEIENNRPMWFFSSLHIADLIWMVGASSNPNQEFLETLSFELQLPTRQVSPGTYLKICSIFESLQFYPKSLYRQWFYDTACDAQTYSMRHMVEIMILFMRNSPENFLDANVNPNDLRDVIRRIRFCLAEDLEKSEISSATFLGLRTFSSTSEEVKDAIESDDISEEVESEFPEDDEDEDQTDSPQDQEDDVTSEDLPEKTVSEKKETPAHLENIFAQPGRIAQLLTECGQKGFYDERLFTLGLRYIRKYNSHVSDAQRIEVYQQCVKFTTLDPFVYSFLESSMQSFGFKQ